MRETKSTQRRRRLRIIKARDTRSEERIRSAASMLENNSLLRKSREDAEQDRQRLAAACGAQLPTRFRIEHPSKETQHVLMNRPVLLIGNHPDCDLRLDDDTVHPHHGSLQWVQGHLFYGDLAPRTGLEQPAKSNGYWVEAGPITVGPYQLFLEATEYPVPPVASPLDRSPLLSTQTPQLALQFLGVEQTDNKWPINRHLTMIGRGSQCKLRLNHPSMPHVQACLLRMEDTCWLIDIERAGTTGVNGRAIRVAPIGIGDVLQLGPFRVEVVATTFAPVTSLQPASVPKPETSTRTNVKLFAPSTVDLGLPQRTGGRKGSAPPKSPTLADSSDMNSAITEISRNNPSTSPKKRPVPTTTILESRRSATPKAPSPADEPPVAHHANSEHPASSKTSIEQPSIAFPQQNRHADVKISTPPTDAKIVTTETAALERQTPPPTIVGSVEQFLREHQLQLTRLQASLDQLKQSCDRSSRHSISKRVRSQLERSIQEAFRTRAEMQDSLALIGKSIGDTQTHSD